MIKTIESSVSSLEQFDELINNYLKNENMELFHIVYLNLVPGITTIHFCVILKEIKIR